MRTGSEERIRNYTKQQGETIYFGIREGSVEVFAAQRGFSLSLQFDQ
jgi:O-methyltransferase involved in polyketide biosynthesis